jgi:tetratricopeptide (TPR) repeat protein
MNAAAYPTLPQDQLFALAVKAMQENDPDTAITCLKEAVSRKDATGTAHFLLGAQYAQAELYDQAAAEFERAIVLQPNLHIARFQLGLLLLSGGNLQGGQAVLTPLAQTAGAGALSQFALGLLHLVRNEFAEAQQYLLRGIELNLDNLPLNADMQKILGRIKESRRARQPQAPIHPISFWLPTPERRVIKRATWN